MLIALEGIDGSGKSTTVKEILQRIDAVVLHSGPTNEDTDVLAEYVNRLADYVPGSGVNMVLDRWHIGELIYGPLYRGGSLLDRYQAKYVDMVLNKLGATKYVLSPSRENVTSRLESRGDDLLRSEHVVKVHQDYLEMAYELGWTVARNDHLAAEDLARHLVDSASLTEIHSRKLSSFPNYVGSPWARLLLVGDERNPNRRDELPHELAFPPYRGSSGHFLLKALVDSAVSLDTVGITNVNDSDDVLQLWMDLGMSTTVIALGVNASKSLGKLNIPHHAVEHPQYVRRFRNKQQRQYGQLIKQFAYTVRPSLDPELSKV